MSTTKYQPVPVETAKSIATEFNKSMVVILSYDAASGQTHTTTYGVSAVDKENAAAAGEKATAAIGSDLSRRVVFEDFHRDYDPARLKECLELLQELDNFIEFADRRLIGGSTQTALRVQSLKQRIHAALTPPKLADWRIGKTIKPKYSRDALRGRTGVVIGVEPSGTDQIDDPNGVLRIRLDDGTVVLRASDEWVTA